MELQDFIDFRKELHQHPELSEKEKGTKERVLNFMKKFKPYQVIMVGKQGLIFHFKGNEPGKSILVRAELDALPIQETNDFNYKSQHLKVSHKCGHDGHMAILAHLAYQLSKSTLKKGAVYLLFQPAEENGKGAKEIFHSEAFQKLRIDYVVALHNIPGYPHNSIIIKEGAFTPAVLSILVKFKGKTSHAAEPENGINPAIAIADFLKKSLALAQPEEQQKDFFLVTPIYLNMGEKSYGVSAGYGEVHLTFRTLDNILLEEKANTLKTLAAQIAEENNLKYEIEWTQEFHANQNNSEMVAAIRSSAQKLHLKIIERAYPMKWGEDFGLFTEHIKGAMFGLGSGIEQPALHNPDYDFPDNLIETGSSMFHQIIRTILEK